MSLEPFVTLRAQAVVLPMDNIDTDQIIPARFLKVVKRAGLGAGLFADWRYDAAGKERAEFILNQPACKAAQILVAGDNFGCGSSREHAPWALLEFGFRAVISTSMADIFRNNALKNGLLPLVVSAPMHARLLQGEGNPLTINLQAERLTLADGTHETFHIDAFARYRLLNGIDELDFLLEQNSAISRYEEAHPCNL